MAETSVIMPVHNGGKYLDDAIKSIVAQTHQDFEFVILNDGSTDNTSELLTYWEEKDERIKVLDSPNMGISASLNQLISTTDSRFIMRMDADDVAMPTRMEKQLRVMREDSQCGIIGSKVKIVGDSSGVWNFRQTDKKTKAIALLGNTCLCHPTWMIRREAIDNLTYSNQFPHMEDMFFLAQYINKPKSKLYAVEDVLLNYRIHDSNVSSLYFTEQIKQRTEILAWTWTQFGVVYNDTDPENFIACFVSPPDNTNHVDIDIISDLVLRICSQLVRLNFCVKDEINKRLEALSSNFNIGIIK